MATVKTMVTLTSANTNYQLAQLLEAAGYGVNFASLQYTSPGSDYATPNTNPVAVGKSTMASLDDGRIYPPGVNFPEPPLSGHYYYDTTQIYLRSNAAGQKMFIEGVTF